MPRTVPTGRMDKIASGLTPVFCSFSSAISPAHRAALILHCSICIKPSQFHAVKNTTGRAATVFAHYSLTATLTPHPPTQNLLQCFGTTENTKETWDQVLCSFNKGDWT